MRKFYLFMAAAFCAATIFTGCSDDDDDFDGTGGNGQGAGNGGSGVEVLAKKVAKISALNDEGQVSETYLFKYDQEGRLSKVINQYGPNGNNYQEEKTFSYSSDKITITEGEEEAVINMKDGKAISYTEKDVNYEDAYTFTYSGNYLYQVTNVGKFLSDGEWVVEYEGKDTYTVKNGNLSSVNSFWKEEGQEDEGTAYLKYGNVANNANIDLGYICYDMEGSELLMLCALGARYQNLPASMSAGPDADGWTYKVDYSYEVDKDNYVTKITITSVESGEGQTHRETDVYEIVYAKMD